MNKWNKPKHFSEHLMTKRRQKIDDMAKVRKVRERLDPTLAMKEGEMHIKRLVAFINATYGNPEHRKPWS